MRFVTAALVVVACAWSALRGLDFVRFQGASAEGGRDLQSAALLEEWTEAPGVSLLALEARLRGLPDSGDMDDLRRREELLIRLLRIKPAASRAWLSLASVRNSLAGPQDQIDAAFITSGLTGPAEGALMVERSLLGVLMWERSSPDVHARTVTDICGTTISDPWKIRLIVTTKAEAVRAEIRAGLESNGCSPATIKTVGL